MDELRPILGAHMSMAGGFHKAVERGQEVGCQCVLVFVKNSNRWTAPDLTDDDVEHLSAAMIESGLRYLIAHSSYLINLASPDRALWKKSLDALVVELQRATRLEIPYVVLHPGAYTSSSEEAGLQRVIRALDEVQRQTRDWSATCLLENTAGQGTCLGWRFEQLATVLDGVQAPGRLGVCFDTCHAFAAGYPLASESEYRQTMRQLQQLVGIDRIKAVHVNDSKRERGSRVDRHEHIGKGQLGITAFARVVNDRRFRQVPMYLETPKGTDSRTAKPWDVKNLGVLRPLVGRPIT